MSGGRNESAIPNIHDESGSQREAVALLGIRHDRNGLAANHPLRGFELQSNVFGEPLAWLQTNDDRHFFDLLKLAIQ